MLAKKGQADLCAAFEINELCGLTRKPRVSYCGIAFRRNPGALIPSLSRALFRNIHLNTTCTVTTDGPLRERKITDFPCCRTLVFDRLDVKKTILAFVISYYVCIKLLEYGFAFFRIRELLNDYIRVKLEVMFLLRMIFFVE